MPLKFSSIRKLWTYTSSCGTVLAVQKFIAYGSLIMLEYAIFTFTEISAIGNLTRPEKVYEEQ